MTLFVYCCEDLVSLEGSNPQTFNQSMELCLLLLVMLKILMKSNMLGKLGSSYFCQIGRNVSDPAEQSKLGL